MKKNMGSTDKAIRVLVAAVIAILYFATDLISGTLGIVLLVAAGIFVLTSLFSFCPIYPVLGMNTCKKK